MRKCVRVSVCMVLPKPLEMLGRPARLFLDQWQRINGCRCVAKKGSEIPADPGRSLPNHFLPVFCNAFGFPLVSSLSTCFSIYFVFSSHPLLFLTHSHYFTPTFSILWMFCFRVYSESSSPPAALRFVLCASLLRGVDFSWINTSQLFLPPTGSLFHEQDLCKLMSTVFVLPSNTLSLCWRLLPTLRNTEWRREAERILTFI